MRLFIYVFAVLTLFSSCKKEKNKMYTIKGRYINACDGSPIVNEVIVITQHGSKGGMYDNSLNSVYIERHTDENGEFEINYETNHTAPLKINNCEGIPIENLDLGNISLIYNSEVFYKVKVNNTYTNIDTLTFGFTDNAPVPLYLMNGPFHDTIIGIKHITNTSIAKLTYDSDLKKIITIDTIENISAFYYINANSYINPPRNNQVLNVKTCNTIADTFVLNIN